MGTKYIIFPPLSFIKYIVYLYSMANYDINFEFEMDNQKPLLNYTLSKD